MLECTLWMNTVLFADSSTLARGLSIALSGITIVFSALLLVAIFIAFLPRILALVARVFPEVKEPSSGSIHPESLVPDDGTVLTAIGFVLHTELQQQLTKEDLNKKN